MTKKVLDQNLADEGGGNDHVTTSSFVSQAREHKLENLFNLFKDLKYTPWDRLRLYAQLPSLKHLTQQNTALANRLVVDQIMNLSEEEKNSFPELGQAYQEVVHFNSTLEKNFNALVDYFDNRNHSPIEAQAMALQKFIGANGFYSEAELAEVYLDEGVDEDDARLVLQALQTAARLVPDKYKANLPPLTLIVRSEENQDPSFANIKDEVFIALKLQDKVINLFAEAFHEYMHLVEKFNPAVMLKTNRFLLERRLNTHLEPLIYLAQRDQKPYQSGMSQIYDNNFIDLYVGKPCNGELDVSLKALIQTEILSVGAQALALCPYVLYLKDPEHFQLIKDMLTGQI